MTSGLFAPWTPSIQSKANIADELRTQESAQRVWPIYQSFTSHTKKLMRHGLLESKQEPSSPEHHFRVFSWNVNGVEPFIQRPISFSKSITPFRSPLHAFLARHNWPHVLCLQEVKINPKDAAAQRALQHAANLESQALTNVKYPASPSATYSIHFSLPRHKYNAT